jgi:hypothetical protein
MTREVTFALRPAHELGHGISIRNKVGLYSQGNFPTPIIRSSPGEQELILYLSLLLRS